MHTRTCFRARHEKTHVFEEKRAKNTKNNENHAKQEKHLCSGKTRRSTDFCRKSNEKAAKIIAGSCFAGKQMLLLLRMVSVSFRTFRMIFVENRCVFVPRRQASPRRHDGDFSAVRGPARSYVQRGAT